MAKKFPGLSLKELPREVKAEVLKPFSEKLERAQQLLSLWSKVKSYVSCSFGKDSMVLLFLFMKLCLKISVSFYLFKLNDPGDLPLKRVFWLMLRLPCGALAS